MRNLQQFADFESDGAEYQSGERFRAHSQDTVAKLVQY